MNYTYNLSHASTHHFRSDPMSYDSSMNKKNAYVGRSIGRYSFVELIGKGAIGEVYRAFDERLLRQVAIKVSFPHIGEEARHVDRIVREAQIIARVEHANIVPIYDVIDHAQSALIVMRLVKGKNLGQMICHLGKPLDATAAYKIMYQVMLGMDFAHRKGVVHSDLKPGNIFVTDSDEIFILDFGLAALLELEKMDKSKVYGTPLYMSPEQIEGVYLDARSDIYSLGLVLYVLITGHHPFEGIQALNQLFSLQAKQVPEAPDKINPTIPEKFSECVMRALEKDPRKRYYSCREFLHEMEKTLPSIGTEEYKSKELRWHPRTGVDLKAQLQLHDTSELIVAKITNLSVSGASILAPISLKMGSKLMIEFDLREDDNYVTIISQATVMWMDRMADNHMIEIGVSFEGLEDMDKQYLGLYVRDLLLG